MAKFIPLLGQLSGTIAGLVFSHNRNGAYVRQRALPINPLTNMQSKIRSIFAGSANAWSITTDIQKTAWRAYAQTMPLVDSLGQSYFISGFNAYVRGNSFRLYNALASIADGPVQGGQATPMNVIPQAITLLDSTSAVPNTIRVNTSAVQGFARASNDTVLQVSLGPILPAGVLFFSTPFQVKGSIPGDSASPPGIVDIPAGLVLEIGQRLAIGLRWADAEARVSPPYQEIETVVNVP